MILTYLTEAIGGRITIYHGDNHGLDAINGNYKVMALDGSNQQEGCGIYFTTSKKTADSYGKYVVSTTVNPKRFMNSRELISDYVSPQKIMAMLVDINKSLDGDEFYYFISDYVEVGKTINRQQYAECARILSGEQVRNFLITLNDLAGSDIFVPIFLKHSKYFGTFYNQNNDDNEIHFALLANDDEVRSES